MKQSSLLQAVRIERLNASVANGATAVNSSSVSLGPGQGVLFLTELGAITAAPKIKVQTSSDDAAWNDLAGTEDTTITATDDDKVAAVDIKRPLERYLRISIDRSAGNSEVDGILAIVYNVQELPVTQAADQVAGEAKSFLAVAEGTA
tara:strand:- start:25 stop:468 length:444 start_codon:yes stop_codon:yes gene_type:complete